MTTTLESMLSLKTMSAARRRTGFDLLGDTGRSAAAIADLLQQRFCPPDILTAQSTSQRTQGQVRAHHGIVRGQAEFGPAVVLRADDAVVETSDVQDVVGNGHLVDANRRGGGDGGGFAHKISRRFLNFFLIVIRYSGESRITIAPLELQSETALATSSTFSGQSCKVAGSKSAPFGQTSV